MQIRWMFLLMGLTLGAPLASLGSADLPTFRQNYNEPKDMLSQAKAHIAYLRRSGQLIEDPFAMQYLYDLGNYLAGFSSLAAYQFRFYIKKDSSINAYAMPGGNIVLHTGLIEATRSLDELVAVIAHEMAHIQRAHLLRRDEKLADDTLPILAGTLASLALMSVNPQAAMAGISSIQALSAQSLINTTRDYEWEADEMGIQMMQAAGYEPLAMARFFEQLGMHNHEIPEILLTHPVTQKRISAALANAERMPKKSAKKASEDRLGYPYLKALIQGQSPSAPDEKWLKLHAPWSLARQAQHTAQAIDSPAKRASLNYLKTALEHSAYPEHTYRLMAKLYFDLDDKSSSHWALAMAFSLEEDYREALKQISIALDLKPAEHQRQKFSQLQQEWMQALQKQAAPK